MNPSILNKSIRVLLFIALLYAVLYYGRPFLVPLTFAMVLSMLLLPLSLKMEGWGLNRALSIVLSILALVLFFAGVIALLSWQVSDMAKNADQIEQNVNQKVQEARQFVTRSLGISEQKQQEVIQKQQQSSGNQLASTISAAFAGFGTLLANFLLVLVYIFLFLYFRTHLKTFVLKLVPPEDKAKAGRILDGSWRVAQKYITGLALMIVCLWVMYGIGFTIAGAKNAIFFAVLCGLLEIVPFVGNIAGTSITLLANLAQGAGSTTLIGILITYGTVQFLQSYLLEPLVVGKEVSINPVATIVGIIAGEFVWGIPGMILAIPLMGILKIICDNIEALKPYGYLLGEEKGKGKGKNFVEKIREKFRKKREASA